MITKAIIPIAGLGTRMYPLSKVVPKALLPVYSKPVVQWIVEELVSSGVEEIIFVYSKGQEIIMDFFGEVSWLERELDSRGKLDELQSLCEVQRMAKFHFVEQEQALGDGQAVLQARHLMGDEPFLVVFGDCLWGNEGNQESGIRNQDGGSCERVTLQMLQRFELQEGCIIGLSEVEAHEVGQFGIVEVLDSGEVKSMVEKPEPGAMESRLAIVGRYVLTPSIWGFLEQGRKESGEMRLIDALNGLLHQEPVYGLELEGTWLDTGSVEGLWMAGEWMRGQRKT